MSKTETTTFDIARDELFGHIHRCGVLRATVAERDVWMEDTIGYVGECHPELSTEQLGELRTIGLRFCSPVISNIAPLEVEAAEPAEAEADELALAS